MKKYLFFILSLISTCFLYAQDSNRVSKSISITQGFNHLVTKDLYRSPYVYQGLNPYTALTFERTSAKSIHRIHSGVIFGTIRTSFSPLASAHMLNIDYTYLKRIIQNKRFNFNGGLQLEGISWRVNYFPEMNVPSYGKVHSYMLGLSAGVAFRVEYKVSSRSHLKLSLSSPVSTYMDRPHFLDGSRRQAQLGFLNFWNPKLSLNFEHSISEKISLNINYQYQYLHYSKPKDIRMLSNGLSIGLKLKF